MPAIIFQAKSLPDTISRILKTACHNNQWFLEVLGSWNSKPWLTGIWRYLDEIDTYIYDYKITPFSICNACFFPQENKLRKLLQTISWAITAPD